jgi:hypothetical protein
MDFSLEVANLSAKLTTVLAGSQKKSKKKPMRPEKVSFKVQFFNLPVLGILQKRTNKVFKKTGR